MMRARTNISLLVIPVLWASVLAAVQVEKTESPANRPVPAVQKKTAGKSVEQHTKQAVTNTQKSKKKKEVNKPVSKTADQKIKKQDVSKESASAQKAKKSNTDAVDEKKTASAEVETGLPADMYEVDRVVAKIYAPEETISILASDIKPSLDGAVRTCDDIIFEHLVCLEAKKYKIVTEEEDIDKAIAGIQKEHNIDLNQLKQVLKASGYSYEEGRAAIGKMRIQAQMYDFKIKQRLTLSDADIEAYYNENPEMEPASYQIAKAFVPHNSAGSAQNLMHELETMVSAKTKLPYVEWQEPFWIEQGSLAQDKIFLTQLEPGELSGPYDVGDGYELYELVAKKEECLKPLKDRYAQIANTLRRPKYEELLAQYKKELFESATIRYT